MDDYSRVPLLLALLICVETITVVGANDGVILVEPHSVNTTLNTSVQFYCEGRGTIIFWKIDGVQLAHNLNKHRGVEQRLQQTNTTTNTILSILDVPAQPVNDGATFTCSVVGTESSESHGAVLRIQGLLAEVGNLRSE